MTRRRALLTGLAIWAAWRLFGPEPKPRFPGRQTRPDGPPGRTVIAGRHEFLIRESGPRDAPPVVLLHGWLYDSHATWHRVIPMLAEHRRVITIDLRNHGRTERIRTRFDIADVADDVARLFDALDLAGVPVVGYSMGGMAALELAVRHPGRISKLILSATAAHPVPWPRWATVPMMTIGRTLSRIDRFLLPRIAHRYMTRTGVIPPEHSAWLWQTLGDRDVERARDPDGVLTLVDAAARARTISLPFGFERGVWDEILARAAGLSDEFERDGDDDDVIVERATDLRNLLRPFV